MNTMSPGDAAPSEASDRVAHQRPGWAGPAPQGCDGSVSRRRSIDVQTPGFATVVSVYVTQTWSIATVESPTTKASKSTSFAPVGRPRTSTKAGGCVSELVAGVR